MSESRDKASELARGHWVSGYQRFDVADSWMHHILRLLATLEHTDPDYELHQVKEKFGELRFYTGPLSPAGADLVSLACIRCSRSCVRCGDSGSQEENNAFANVLCDEHKLDNTRSV